MSVGARPSRAAVQSQQAHGASPQRQGEGGADLLGPLQEARRRNGQLERNNLNLAKARERALRERELLKKQWRSEAATNARLRSMNRQMAEKIEQLELRVERLEAAQREQQERWEQLDLHEHAPAEAGTVSFAASAAGADEHEHELRTEASVASDGDGINTSGSLREVQQWFEGLSESPAADENREPIEVVESPAVARLHDAADNVEDCMQKLQDAEDGLHIAAALAMASSPHAPVSPVPQRGRSRRKAALEASTNLLEPSIRQRMTQGMRQRGELSGMLRHRPGTYHDTWQGWEVED